MRKGILFFTFLAVLVSINVYSSGSSEIPKDSLIGEWVIKSMVPRVSPHHKFIFYQDEIFEIYDEDGIMIERNRMTDITNSSFVGNIIYTSQNHPLPEIEGTSTYALYEFENKDSIKLQFYDDKTMVTKYVTFYLNRMKNKGNIKSTGAEQQQPISPITAFEVKEPLPSRFIYLSELQPQSVKVGLGQFSVCNYEE